MELTMCLSRGVMAESCHHDEGTHFVIAYETSGLILRGHTVDLSYERDQEHPRFLAVQTPHTCFPPTRLTHSGPPCVFESLNTF